MCGVTRSHATPEILSKAYPHVCGAALSYAISLASAIGLSPRVWGSPHRPHAPGATTTIRSFILRAKPPSACAWGDPRPSFEGGCGLATVRMRLGRPLGLSPRVWGSLAQLYDCSVVHRSIPTCVGQPPPSACAWGDHNNPVIYFESKTTVRMRLGRPTPLVRRRVRSGHRPHAPGATEESTAVVHG